MEEVTSPVDASRFLALPGELRNKIYTFILLDHVPQGQLTRRPQRPPFSVPAVSIGPFAFTQVCHQIRDEFRQFFIAKLGSYLQRWETTNYVEKTFRTLNAREIEELALKGRKAASEAMRRTNGDIYMEAVYLTHEYDFWMWMYVPKRI